MKRFLLSAYLFHLLSVTSAFSQEIQITVFAPLEQTYGEVFESPELMTMNDMGIDFGYALYETELKTEEENPTLEVESIRDYATVYLNGKLQGCLTDDHKSLLLNIAPGTYQLQIYAENIGRITYGPEILDNSKGLFGAISLNGAAIENWKMIPLLVRETSVNELTFGDKKEGDSPCFHKGTFEMNTPKDCHISIKGWGMGELWVNGEYLGAYWEENATQSIEVPASVLKQGKNEVVLFELKNNSQRSVSLSDKPVYK